MKNKLKFVVIIAVMICSFKIELFAGETSSSMRPTKFNTLQERMQYEYDQLKPSTIYGKIVDQHGNVVSGATVSLSWEGAEFLIGKTPERHEEVVLTDNNGLFEYGHGKTVRVSLQAEKDGYDGRSATALEHVIHPKTTNENPVVLTMRKMEAPSFLIKRDSPAKLLWTEFKEPAEKSVDLLDYGKKNSLPIGQRYIDFTVKASYAESNQSWKVVYKADGVNGVLCADQLLYVAPETGYKKEEVLYCSSPSERTIYLYVKSRDPAIYSRVVLTHSAWIENGVNNCFRVMCQTWINPCGERLLEDDLRVDYDTEKELVKEATEAILSKKHMPKPDVPLRVKQNKEKLEAISTKAASRRT
ncbi:MAG: carboxypeptidase-like regulatory domain-containing protein [Kiritimatiellae bacterium]|nr:carboxypeptidase-like regulatory domain-containing protein [Kiritimatiellia bacterium]